MDYNTYKTLEKEVLGVVVTGATTEIQAGYMLGIQSVLAKLRDGFVVNVR